MKNIGFKRAVKTAFFPARCPYCDIVIDPERYACADCGADLPEIPVISYIEGGFRCVSPFLYTDCYAEAVKRFKFSGRAQYSEQLAFAVVTALNCSGDLGFDHVTCVPMHPKRIRRRGFNQAELLARELASLTEVPYEPMLRKTRDNPPQHKMNGFPEKIKNVRGLFKVEGSAPRGRRVLIVDDVITSGATLGACARALKNSGASAVSCVTVCGQRNK